MDISKLERGENKRPNPNWQMSFARGWREEAPDSPHLEPDLRALVLERANQGRYPEAIALLDRLLEQNPRSALDYNNRGLMYFQSGQYAEAIADYNRAIELNPRLDSAYNNRANCYAAQGNLAAALTDYEVALDFNPGNLRALINQGVAYRQMGLYDLALENFDLALFLGRRLKGRIYGERGRTYHLRGDWNSAIADYQRAIEHLPKTLSARRYRKHVESWLRKLLNPMSA